MKNINKGYIQKIAAAKSGMDVKTARKYLRRGLLPSELKKSHNWRTRGDVFVEVWEEIEVLLLNSPGLQAKTVMEYLIRKYPNRFGNKHLRTLQRRFKEFRAENGGSKAVIFRQEHVPGLQSQSDYTNMNELGITIAGQEYKHLLFHFMLVYSRWESVSICHEESFMSLVTGYEEAVWKLGFVAAEHRTDNLTAAVKNNDTNDFTEGWQKVMKHYGVIPSRNNPGVSHENGSIEKSHDLFKTAVKQQLMLRGSSDFKSIDEYKKFLVELARSRNLGRKEKLLKELPKLKELPEDKWYSPKVLPVRVSPCSTIQIDKVAYSVPSRLISYTLTAHIYPDKIKLYYGQKCLQEMPRLAKGELIDYRHIIDSLLRKPGAFKHYQYQTALFPKEHFKLAHEQLIKYSNSRGDKLYLQILQLAKLYGEQQINIALKLLFEEQKTPLPEEIKSLLNLPLQIPKVKVERPNLEVYDQLRDMEGRNG